MGKNDLSDIIIKNENILPEKAKEGLLPKKVGRPKVSKDENQSETISIKITPKEMAVLEKKAGLVPLGRYIKHHLRTTTDIFK